MTAPFKPEVSPWLAEWIGRTQADATRVAPQTPQLPPIPTIGPANAPARSGVQQALEGYNDPRRPLVEGLQAAQTAAEFLPGPAGDVASLGAAVREYRAGNPGMAALSAAAALPFVPVGVKTAGKDAKRGKKAEQGAELFHPSGQVVRITPSARAKGEWQLTRFDASGGTPLAHSTGTRETMEAQARENGFDLAAPPKARLDEDDAELLGGLEDRLLNGDTPLDADELATLNRLRQRERELATGAASADAATDFSKWSPEQLDAYGVQHGVKNLGTVSKPGMVKLTDGREVNIPGGTDGTFSYYDLLTLKSQGINPNLLPDGMHEQIHAKMVRSMMPDDAADEDIFRMLVFGLTSPNSPLTPNEFTVSRLMGSMDDIRAMGKMKGKSDPEIAAYFGINKAKDGGLGSRGSLDYKNLPAFAEMFSRNPKWFRRGADEAWDDYADRIATQVSGLGSKTASLAGVWQDLPNAAISAVDRHMAELAMPHILDHAELGPDFRKRVVKSWNQQKDAVLEQKGGMVSSLEELRERDPIYARDFLASLVNSPRKVNLRDRKGNFGKNVPDWMKKVKWIQEPESTALLNPYYREALKYNQGLQRPGESLFASQWRLWDKQRGRIEPHEVMFPGLWKLPRMPLEESRKAYNAHKRAKYTIGKPTKNNPVAVGGQLPQVKPVANPMDLAYWGLGGLLLGGRATSAAEE